MGFPTPPPEVANAGLRALNAVAGADGTVHQLERELLSSVQRHILGTEVDVSALEPITPEQLAADVAEPMFRERIIGGCVLMALIDGEPSKAELELVEAYAKALDVSMSVLTNLKRLTKDRLLIARFDIARRSFIGQKIKERLANEGVRGLANVFKAMRLGDEQMAARYQKLESLPDGTLGREYARFIRDSGFAFPGEEDGAPEVILFHDCTHVLGGYGTAPIEEVQVASFSAAFRKEDPFAIVLFVVAQFHLGLQVTPSAPGEKLVVEPELMMKAIARGAQVNTDLSDNWDPWQGDFEVQLEELRRRYNIPPRTPSE
jgi:tellurite resistance protein